MKRIVLTGGGTAGHVSANQALIPRLLEEGWDIHYLGTGNGIERSLIEPISGVTYHIIQSGKLRRYFDVKNFTDIFRVIAGFFQSTALLGRLKPQIVFAKGGFVSVPVVYGAALNRIPVVMHESDITPGLANKLCKPFARCLCTTFPECARQIGKKGVFTGSPLRRELFSGSRERGLQLTGFDGKKPILMMTGGSLGAQTVNDCFRAALPSLLPDYDILHLCGKGNLSAAHEHLAGYCQVEYLTGEMPDAFACADLILSRAGSNTLTEILALGKPALFIPYHSGRGDQILNARSIGERGLGKVLMQDKMTPESLVEAIHELDRDKETLITALRSLPNSDGTDAVLDVIHRYAKPEK